MPRKRRYERRGRLYSARYSDPLTGKRRRISLPTEEAIDDFLADVRLKARNGTYIDPDQGRLPFASYADEFLAGLSHLSPGGYRNVETAVRLHIKPHFADHTVGSIRPAHVRAWVKALKDSRLSPATIAKTYQTFARMMKVAVTDGYRADSPCVDIRLPTNDAVNDEHVYLSARQVLDLADAISPRYSALILLGAWGGLRISEMIALSVEDCRLDGVEPHVIVRASMEDLGSKQRRKTTKTDKVRRVNLPHQVALRMKAHIAHFPPKDGYVFTSEQGRPINRRNFYRRHFRPAVEGAPAKPAKRGRSAQPAQPPALPPDKQGMRIHDLRHTCAALLISNGESLSVVAHHLGHSTERTTERYKHLLPTANQRAIAKLADEYDRALEAA